MKLRFVTFDGEGTVAEIIETPTVDFLRNQKKIAAALDQAFSALFDKGYVRVERIREDGDPPCL